VLDAILRALAHRTQEAVTRPLHFVSRPTLWQQMSSTAWASAEWRRRHPECHASRPQSVSESSGNARFLQERAEKIRFSRKHARHSGTRNASKGVEVRLRSLRELRRASLAPREFRS
jgi:hypothetical protein